MVSEADGGLRMGHVGRDRYENRSQSTPSPFSDQFCVGTTALEHGGDDLRGRCYLPGLLTGDSVFAVAIDRQHRRADQDERLKKSGNGTNCRQKDFVIHGASADMIG
jgi:hypothetical protein